MDRIYCGHTKLVFYRNPDGRVVCYSDSGDSLSLWVDTGHDVPYIVNKRAKVPRVKYKCCSVSPEPLYDHYWMMETLRNNPVPEYKHQPKSFRWDLD